MNGKLYETIEVSALWSNEYLRVVGIQEMVEKRGRYIVCYPFQSLAGITDKT